jgi:protein involved in polysaccharide export with SLBB domain
MPQTVQVLGAVFNPHAFIFRPGATVSEFLQVAGGPTRNADRRRIFILRADGTVFSRYSESLLFARAFKDTKLQPGDSIVVPEKNLRLSTIAQIFGWIQSASQASLPAVEASVLAH